MEKNYESYDGSTMELLEILKRKILFSKINIKIDPKDKGLLFLLGFTFAAGRDINIINKEDMLEEVEKYKLDLENPSKSFKLMAYAWERLGMENPAQTCEFDKIIDNYKRLGLKPKEYLSKITKYQQIFLISPVRNASANQKEQIEAYKRICEENKYQIHTPHIDTVQTDMLGGYTICHQNAEEVAKSEAVHLYYDKNSMGSMFDLGVAYACNKPLILINEEDIEFDRNDFGDRTVESFNAGVFNESNTILKHTELVRKLK